MYALTAGVEIAKAAAGTDDPEDVIAWFHKLPWEDQVAAVPDANFEGMSGNQFGYACNVAFHIVMESCPERTCFLRWGHGAMVPLVGCTSYGCTQPNDDDLRACGLNPQTDTEDAPEGADA